MNVGVLLHCPSANFLRLTTRDGGTRVTDAYPDIDRTALLHDLREMERWFEKRSLEACSDWLFRSALEIGAHLTGTDDSGFRWYLDGSGVTASPDAALKRLFDRFVTRYDSVSDRQARSDEQVFETVRTNLNAVHLLNRLESHTISSEVSEVKFDHAIKNGKWHCIQPISFDSANSEQMQRKAERFAGKLVGIQAAPKDFVVYMVTGRPTKYELEPHYRRMIELLRHAPTQPEVIEEENSGLLVAKLASRM